MRKSNMNIEEKIAGKNILITGGTGSFGHPIVAHSYPP